MMRIEKQKYSIEEVKSYIQGKADMNYTDTCFIVKETKQSVTIQFKEQRGSIRRWFPKPNPFPALLKAKAKVYA